MFADDVPYNGATEDLVRRLAFAEAVTRATPDCLYIYDVVSNQFRYQNMTVQDFLGYSDAELAEVEGDFYEWVGHPTERDMAVQRIRAQKSLRVGEHMDHNYRLRRADGAYRWYSLRIVAFSAQDDGSPREVLGLLRDVHDAVISAERLDESERRFRDLFERSPGGIALVTDDGVFAEVNEALCKFLDMSRLELIDADYDSVLHPDDREGAQQAREVYRNETDPKTHRHQRRFIRPDKSIRWAHMSVTRIVDEGRPINLVSFEDVTATKEIEERLHHAAMHDSLTGLPNRRMLIDAMDDALSRRRRTLRPLAVLFVDLDRVKQVNDRLGHEAGDELLIRVSRRLELTMRVTDTVARVGGDEFVIVCPDLDSVTEVPMLAQRVLEALRINVMDRGDDPLEVSGSIGIALASDELDNPNGLIAAADRAMYEAKRAGRDRYLIADESRPAPPACGDGEIAGAASA